MLPSCFLVSLVSMILLWSDETFRQMVKRWTMSNHFRFVLLSIALGLAISALKNFSTAT
jgi:hypothetical protein